MDTLMGTLPPEILEYEILPNFNCDMTKSLNQNYWNYCVRTLNRYLSMFEFFHKAVIEEPQPTNNQLGMLPGEPAHRHQAMVDFIEDLDVDLLFGNTPRMFYLQLENVMKSMFNNRIETEDLLNVGIYSEEMNTLRRSTSSIIIQRTINRNRGFLDRAYLIYSNWIEHYNQIEEDEFNGNF